MSIRVRNLKTICIGRATVQKFMWFSKSTKINAVDYLKNHSINLFYSKKLSNDNCPMVLNLDFKTD